ncbi:aminodeoxychorismate lyase [Diplocarpon rosae]|nr:aminodeoxychorismate lyase [Diplocarpon rosae]
MPASPDFQLFSSLRYDPLVVPLAVNTEAGHGESTRLSPFYMLPYHRDRMLQAAEYFGWTRAAEAIRDTAGLQHLLRQLTEAIDTHSPTPLRLKTLLSHDGAITVESRPCPAVTRWALYPPRIPPPSHATAAQAQGSSLTGGILPPDLGGGHVGDGEVPAGQPWDVIPDTARTTPSPYTRYKTTSRDAYDAARVRVGIEDVAEKREVVLVSERDGELMEGSLTTVFFWREGKWMTPPVSSGGQMGTTRRWALEQGHCVEGVVKLDSLVEGEECWISNGVRGFQLGKIKLHKE